MKISYRTFNKYLTYFSLVVVTAGYIAYFFTLPQIEFSWLSSIYALGVGMAFGKASVTYLIEAREYKKDDEFDKFNKKYEER